MQQHHRLSLAPYTPHHRPFAAAGADRQGAGLHGGQQGRGIGRVGHRIGPVGAVGISEGRQNTTPVAACQRGYQRSRIGFTDSQHAQSGAAGFPLLRPAASGGGPRRSSGTARTSRVSATSPSAAMMVNAAEPPTWSASQPTCSTPSGPAPMQTDNTPISRERIAGGASPNMMAPCIEAKPAMPNPPTGGPTHPHGHPRMNDKAKTAARQQAQ